MDDEPAILSAIERVLRREPYELRTTIDPAQAQAWTERDRVSVIVIDQRMPEMNGTDLVRRIENCSPRTARVMLTGYPDTHVMLERIHRRVRRILNKPWDDLELRDTIRTLLCEIEIAESIPAAPAVEPEPVSETPAARPKWEIVLSIDGRGRSAEELMGKIVPRIRRAESEGAGVFVLIDNVTSITGSVASLMRRLLGEALNSKVGITLVDRSGCLSSYLDALGNAAVPIEVVREFPVEPVDLCES